MTTDLKKNNQKLFEASKKGQLEEVKQLLSVSDLKVYESYALRLASQYGHTEVVKLLISVSDPKVNRSEALCWSCHNKNQEIFDLLYSVSEPEKALYFMKKENKKGEEWDFDLLEERLKIEQQHQKLSESLKKYGKTKDKNLKI